MFRFFVCISLILFYVSCETTEEFNTDFDTTQQAWEQETTEQPFDLSTNYETSQSWEQETTEQPLELSTDYETSQSWNEMTTEQQLENSTNTDITQSWDEMTSEQPLENSTNIDTTQSWEEITTEESLDSTAPTQIWEEVTSDVTSEQESSTTTTQQITSTMPTTTSATCPPSISPELLEETKNEIIDTVLGAISREITSKLEAIEARLSALTCPDDTTSPPVQLSWLIYENLQIRLRGWTRVFDHPYSHKTRTDDLNQIAGMCHNQVLVGATFNGTISVAAVGPVSVLTLNTVWNLPQQFGQVYWYRTNGKSFGFSPLATIRQTSADNEDLGSPLRLSWFLDQNTGGYRAGATRLLVDNPLWHKVIYCN